MSMNSQIAAFAARAAAARADWFGATSITPIVNGVSQPAVSVVLPPSRDVREITINGDVLVHSTHVRVPWSCSWRPAERDEFIVVGTGERYRLRSVVASQTMAETVCEAIRV